MEMDYYYDFFFGEQIIIRNLRPTNYLFLFQFVLPLLPLLPLPKKMTTNLLIFRPIRIRPSAASGSNFDHRKPKPHLHVRPQWRPGLLDYINDNTEPDLDSIEKVAESRFSIGCFTEEKARQLRIMTTKGNSFREGMYHSAIASRLASDFSNANNYPSTSIYNSSEIEYILDFESLTLFPD